MRRLVLGGRRSEASTNNDPNPSIAIRRKPRFDLPSSQRHQECFCASSLLPALYAEYRPKRGLILAIAPEAQVDRRGFEGAIRDAKQRLEDLQARRDSRER